MERVRTRTVTRTLIETERACPVCKKKFFGFGRAVYCSPSCKQKADYEKHAEARRAHRREVYREQKEHGAEKK